MGFKPITSLNTGLDFNTSISSNFKDLYDNIVINKYKAQRYSKSSKTFAPSSFRCDRISFFRLRGIEPDNIDSIDTSLEFTAVLGTACHKEIQNNLKSNIGNQWVKVSEFLNENPISVEYSLDESDEFETKVFVKYPPVKFSCDGLIKIGEEYYLLEIKTSEYQTFKSLCEPKKQHIDQVKCYCSLLNLHKALILYQDRSYGNIKCYELNISDYEINEVFDRMKRVLEYVESNIAPPKLPQGDYWCTFCKYKNKCKQWG